MFDLDGDLVGVSVAQSNASKGNGPGGQGSKRRVDPYAKGVPVLTPAAAQDIIVDLYCAILSSLQKSGI